MTLRNNPNPPAVFIDADEITPHDTEANVFKGIYVGGTGDITLITHRGTTVEFESIPVGTYLPIATSKVLSTGTTATKLVGYKM